MPIPEENSSLAARIPPVDELEERFCFIKDDVLRVNTALAFQYITFLVAVIDQEEAENTTVGATAHKSMIIYTATIVEGCLHYCLRKYIESEAVNESEVMGFEDKYREEKKLCNLPDEEKMCAVIKYKAFVKYKEDLAFQPLLRACKRAGILTDSTFAKADDIRDKRNKIHLAGLGEVDDVYTKEDVQEVFANTRDVLRRVETMLERL